MKERSFRAGAAGTCQAWCGGAPPHCCSPYPRPAIPQWDSSPMRRSATATEQDQQQHQSSQESPNQNN